jgi:hypothetical protein
MGLVGGKLGRRGGGLQALLEGRGKLGRQSKLSCGGK